MCRKVNARGAQENLWPKFFLERPVARHFVWYLNSTQRAVSNLQKMQAMTGKGFVGIALRRERFTSGAGGQAWRWPNGCGKEQTGKLCPSLAASGNFRYNSSGSFPAKANPAPLAQLDRASGYEPEGREFESLRAHHLSPFPAESSVGFPANFPTNPEIHATYVEWFRWLQLSLLV